MTTLTLNEAAAFLHVTSDWLRKEAKVGRIPRRKVGRLWRFLEEDLVVWMRSGYPEPRHTRTSLVEVSWDYSKEDPSGSSILRHPAAKELRSRLGQPTAKKRRSSTTA